MMRLINDSILSHGWVQYQFYCCQVGVRFIRIGEMSLNLSVIQMLCYDLADLRRFKSIDTPWRRHHDYRGRLVIVVAHKWPIQKVSLLYWIGT